MKKLLFIVLNLVWWNFFLFITALQDFIGILNDNPTALKDVVVFQFWAALVLVTIEGLGLLWFRKKVADKLLINNRKGIFKIVHFIIIGKYKYKY